MAAEVFLIPVANADPGNPGDTASTPAKSKPDLPQIGLSSERIQKLISEVAEGARPRDLEDIGASILGPELTLERADNLGLIDATFELWKSGVPLKEYDYRSLYGDLVDHATLVIGKSPDHIKIEQILNTTTNRHEIHIVFTRKGWLFDKWNGSRLKLGTRFHDFISFTEDKNGIFLLDRTGRIYFIDKNSLRRTYGKYSPPQWLVGQTYIDPKVDPLTYRLELVTGLPETRTHHDANFRINGRTVEEDIAFCQDVKDGDLKLTQTAPDGTSRVVDLWTRDILLDTATARAGAQLGLLANLRMTPEMVQVMERISPKWREKIAAYRQLHLADEWMTESLEAKQALAASDPERVVSEYLSIQTQAAQTANRIGRNLVDYLAGNPNQTKTLKRDHAGRDRLWEVLSKMWSPAYLFFYAVAAYTIGAEPCRELAEHYGYFTTGIHFLEKLTPVVFDSAYRPILVKAMLAQFALFQGILSTFAAIGYKWKVSSGEAMSLIGYRVYGALTFLSPGNLLYAFNIGMQNAPHRQAEYRRRALAENLAWAAIAETEGLSTGGNVFDIVSQIESARAKRRSDARAPYEAKFDSALAAADRTEMARARYQISVIDAQLNITERRERQFNEGAVRVIATKLDRTLMPETDRLQLASMDPLGTDELIKLRASAKNELSKFKAAGRVSNKASVLTATLRDMIRYGFSKTLLTLGRQLSRDLLFRAEPDPSTAKQSISAMVGDMNGTQFTTYPVWGGWPAKDWLPPGEFQTRADPMFPNQLYAQGGALNLWTNPKQDASFGYQYFAFSSASTAQDYYAIQAGGRDIENEYARSVEVPRHEIHENFRRSFGLWMKVCLQPRVLGYQEYFDQRLANIGRFFIATAWAQLLFRYAIAGESLYDIPFKFIFGAFFAMWAYGWPWAPVGRGPVIAENILKAAYKTFAETRERLQEALDRRELDEPEKNAAKLIRMYQDQRVLFVTRDELARKRPGRWKIQDLELVLAEAIYQSEHLRDHANVTKPLSALREQLGAAMLARREAETELANLETALVREEAKEAPSNGTIQSIRSKIRSAEDVLTEHHTKAVIQATAVLQLFSEVGISFLTIQDLAKQSLEEWTKETALVVLAQSRIRPPVHRELSKGFQDMLNFVIGGGITTLMAIGFDVKSFRSDLSWPSYGTEMALKGLAIFIAVHYAFKLQSLLAERYWDPLVRRIKAYRELRRMSDMPMLAVSQELAERETLDRTRASAKQRQRLEAFDALKKQLSQRFTGCRDTLRGLWKATNPRTMEWEPVRP